MRRQLLTLFVVLSTIHCNADPRGDGAPSDGGTDHTTDASFADSASNPGDAAAGNVGPDGDLADTLDGPARPVGVGAALEHSCLTLSDGTAYCWGLNNADNRLGTSDGMAGFIELEDVVTVAPGYEHTCALLGDGTVWCVGSNEFGQLGNGKTEPSTVFVQVEGIANATQLSVGDHTSCVRLDDGTARCWGAGSTGSLGNGESLDSAVPVVFGVSDVEQISAGLTTVCARLADGTIWCAGRGAEGQLGNGEYSDSDVPVMADVADSIDIQVGGHHSCSLGSDGTVSCWGYDNYGQTGDGSTSNPQADPADVTGVTDAVAISVGSGRDPYGAFSCAILADQTMRCWGHALYGQLGHGSTEPQWEPEPVVVTGLEEVAAVALGGIHAVALTAPGDVHTWGGCNCAAVSDTPVMLDPGW